VRFHCCRRQIRHERAILRAFKTWLWMSREAKSYEEGRILVGAYQVFEPGKEWLPD